MTTDHFRIGVNNWPSSVAMAWLATYDAAAVRRDFARIAATGMDTVRIFARWEDIQPDVHRIERSALDALVDCADAAAELRLQLIVTLFTGHMSGVNWIPRWATGGTEGDTRFRVVSDGVDRGGRPALRNWYADREIVDAHARLAAALASAIAGHPAVWAWDLGNENSNCTVPHSRGDALAWLDRMTSTLRSHDPGRAITIGLHMEDLEEERLIGPAEASQYCDFVSMHGYPTYANWSDGPLDENLVPFLACIATWLASGAPVLFEEFGQSTVANGQPASGVQVTEVDAAVYTARTLDRLRAAGVIGALLWCYSDYATHLSAEPPFDLATHERTFGLWRADDTAKPAVNEINARRDVACVAPSYPYPWIDITADEFLADRSAQLVRLYDRYRRVTSG